MNMSGIERDGELKYQFNGMIEKEEAFGLELYETPFRSYDAQLGRFWQVEPLADIYCSISMYQFAYNNPVSFNDPMGLSCSPAPSPYDPFKAIGIRPMHQGGRGFADFPTGSPMDRTAQWDIVYYDKQGNFVSGDITNNTAVVAISDKDSKHHTFLTTTIETGEHPNYSTTTHFITQGELLDRANWAFGEGNGAALLEYAFAIDNLQKRGRSRYRPFSNEEILKESWNDNNNRYPNIRKISGYGEGEVNGEKTNFWYARQNNQLGSFKSEFASGTDAISATIIAILRLQKDPVEGAFQWTGGKKDVSRYYKGIQKVVTSSFGDKSYHTFYHIKGH